MIDKKEIKRIRDEERIVFGKPGRDVNPEAFATTSDESSLIEFAFGCFTDSLLKFRKYGDKIFKDSKLKEQIAITAQNSMLDFDINPKDIISIYERIGNGKYWTYTSTIAVVSENPYKKEEIFTYDSNDPEVCGQFDPEKIGFFDTLDMRERANKLNIPGDFFFIQETELYYLEFLQEICKSVKLPGLNSFVNNPACIPFGYIGGRSIIKDEHGKRVNLKEDEHDYTGKRRVIQSTLGNLSIAFDKTILNVDELRKRTPEMFKLSMCVMEKASRENYKSQAITLSVTEYMQYCGLKDRGKATKNFLSGMGGLKHYEIRYTEKKPGSDTIYTVNAPLFKSTVQIGKLHKYILNINDGIYELMRGGMYAQYPSQLLHIPDNQPNAIIMGIRFSSELRSNVGKKSAYKLTVKRILDFTYFPIYDSLSDLEKARASQLIISPFFQSLKCLDDMNIFKSELIDPNKPGKDKTLTEDEMSRARREYSYFITLTVKVKWYTEPDYSNVIANKKKYENSNGDAVLAVKKKRGRPKKDGGTA